MTTLFLILGCHLLFGNFSFDFWCIYLKIRIISFYCTRRHVYERITLCCHLPCCLLSLFTLAEWCLEVMQCVVSHPVSSSSI